MPGDWQDEDDGYIRALIRITAKSLARQVYSLGMGVADFEQELRLLLWRRLSRHDPKRGHRRAFVKAVVRRGAAGLLERARAAKRASKSLPRSLNEGLHEGDEGTAEVANTIPDNVHNRRHGTHRRSESDHRDLALDLSELLARLCPADRRLCEKLKRNTASEVARQTGVPRTTLNDRLRKLRRQFERAGLQKYLQIPPSPRLGKRYLSR